MISKEQLVWEPSVRVIAKTAVIGDELINWAEEHELKEVLANETTPLGAMFSKLDEEGNLTDEAEMVPEYAGRFCYRSWNKGRETEEYIENILIMAHGSVLEHTNLTFAISGVSRALTHELTRHRAGVAISQESQRYVDAKGMRFVVAPLDEWLAGRTPDSPLIQEFRRDCGDALERYETWQALYRDLIEERLEDMDIFSATKAKTGLKKRVNESARKFLPNAAETRLVWTLNIRALRHVLEMRGGVGADLEFRRLAAAILRAAEPHLKASLKDMKLHRPGEGDFGTPVVTCKYGKV